MTCCRSCGGIWRRWRTALCTATWRSGGKAFQLLVGIAQLLPLLRRQLGKELHALHGLVALFRRQTVEFLQPLAQGGLAIRRKLLEGGIVFQEVELLVQRQIFVGLEPVTHLPSAFLAGMVGWALLRLGRGRLHERNRSMPGVACVYARGDIQGHQP